MLSSKVCKIFIIILFLFNAITKDAWSNCCDTSIADILKRNVLINVEFLYNFQHFEKYKNKNNFIFYNDLVPRFRHNSLRFAPNNISNLVIKEIPNSFIYPDSNYRVVTYEIPSLTYYRACDSTSYDVSISHRQYNFNRKYLIAYKTSLNSNGLYIEDVKFISGSFLKNAIAKDFILDSEEDILNYLKLKCFNLGLTDLSIIKNGKRKILIKIKAIWYSGEDMFISYNKINPDLVHLYHKNKKIWSNNLKSEISYNK